MGELHATALAVEIETDAQRTIALVDRDGGEACVTIRGTVDVGCVGELAAVLEAACSEETRRLVVDMRDARFVDSAVLGALALAYKRLSASGGEVVVVGARGDVRRSFELTGLSRLFVLLDG